MTRAKQDEARHRNWCVTSAHSYCMARATNGAQWFSHPRTSAAAGVFQIWFRPFRSEGISLSLRCTLRVRCQNDFRQRWQEAQGVLSTMTGVPKIMASLTYGSGLRFSSARAFVALRCCLISCASRFKNTWARLKSCAARTLPMGLGMSRSPGHSRENIRTRTSSGSGSTFSPRLVYPLTGKAGCCAVFT